MSGTAITHANTAVHLHKAQNKKFKGKTAKWIKQKKTKRCIPVSNNQQSKPDKLCCS